MSGNVWEWVSDKFTFEDGSYRMVRGGGWREALVGLGFMSGPLLPIDGDNNEGFRLVRTK